MSDDLEELPRPTGTGWWYAPALGDDYTCGVDLIRSSRALHINATASGTKVTTSDGPLEVIRIICPHPEMNRWLTHIMATRPAIPLHTSEEYERWAEVGLQRYASQQLVEKHPRLKTLVGRWAFRYFRGTQPPLGKPMGEISFTPLDPLDVDGS